MGPFTARSKTAQAAWYCQALRAGNMRPVEQAVTIDDVFVFNVTEDMLPTRTTQVS